MTEPVLQAAALTGEPFSSTDVAVQELAGSIVALASAADTTPADIARAPV